MAVRTREMLHCKQITASGCSKAIVNMGAPRLSVLMGGEGTKAAQIFLEGTKDQGAVRRLRVGDTGDIGTPN